MPEPEEHMCPVHLLPMIPETQDEEDPDKVVCPQCGRKPGDS